MFDHFLLDHISLQVFLKRFLDESHVFILLSFLFIHHLLQSIFLIFNFFCLNNCLKGLSFKISLLLLFRFLGNLRNNYLDELFQVFSFLLFLYFLLFLGLFFLFLLLLNFDLVKHFSSNLSSFCIGFIFLFLSFLESFLLLNVLLVSFGSFFFPSLFSSKSLPFLNILLILFFSLLFLNQFLLIFLLLFDGF